MKKLKYFCSAMLVFALMAIPATAQKSRSNKGAKNTGDARADLVKSENKDKDKDKDKAPDNDTNKGRHKGETQGRHKARGHRH